LHAHGAISPERGRARHSEGLHVQPFDPLPLGARWAR
jgi:hypothetical protein